MNLRGLSLFATDPCILSHAVQVYACVYYIEALCVLYYTVVFLYFSHSYAASISFVFNHTCPNCMYGTMSSLNEHATMILLEILMCKHFLQRFVVSQGTYLHPGKCLHCLCNVFHTWTHKECTIQKIPLLNFFPPKIHSVTHSHYPS